jgi:hypothetical protein
MSQLTLLFGSLLVPAVVFEAVNPILSFVNIAVGSVFLGSKGKNQAWIIISVLILIGGIFTYPVWDKTYDGVFNFLKLSILFLFQIVVTLKIIAQIWQAKLINKNVIFGVMSGFISLGMVGLFICLSIEFAHTNSFSGLYTMDDTNTSTERLVYFSYITLLTIGYGDILPLTHLAQKATILIGLVGQFYLVIITGIIVGKFINQTNVQKGEL